MNTKTTVTKGNHFDRKWHLVDLEGQTLGRVCVKIANLLMGKNKIDFSPNRDAGDYVVCINADKVQVTGRKMTQKIYYHYTGYAGNMKEFTFKAMMARNPAEVISRGVAGMIPKNKLRAPRLTRLKVSSGATHPYNDKFTN
ncbi:50S ribosomal protein L13 [Candidatus Shapirobacteria bacterium]|nr:50S ribosomal protein L13 [Candidatus Shapirobacteria bacterium]